MNPSTTPFDIQSQGSIGDFFRRLFTADFMPHGHCFYWRSEVLWLHVVSDIIIALAYYSIPVMLFYFVYRNRNAAFNFMFMMFAAFIFLCGTTHLMDVYTMWKPAYRIEGVVKALTALVSLSTAIAMLPLLPRAINFPRMESLLRQITDKSHELTNANEHLERFNRIAMGRENRIIELKQEVNRLAIELGRRPPYEISG